MKKTLPLLVILLFALFFKGYQLEQLFPFEWDQERDAQEVWKILKQGDLTLIGPRVVGPTGFFLGPLWYYLLVPFYGLFNMDPLAAAVFALLVGLFTTSAIYWFAYRWWGLPAAVIASLWWATLPDRISWNPILIPLTTLGIWFLSEKLSRGNTKMLIWLGLVFGLSLQLHFQAIFFLLPIGLALYWSRNTKSVLPFKYIVISLIVFLLTLAPLILFNIRNNGVNIKSLLNFFSQPQTTQMDISWTEYLVRPFNKQAEAFSFLLPEALSSNRLVLGWSLWVAAILFLEISSYEQKRKWLLSSLILYPPLIFIFYRGEISEYYFTLSTVAVVLAISSGLDELWRHHKKLKVVIGIFLLTIFGLRAYELLKAKNSLSLYYKKQAVSYIINQKLDPDFNVSYSVPANYDNGFRYLFKFYGKEPVDSPEGHLWTIVIPPESENVKPLAVFGGIGVIRR